MQWTFAKYVGCGNDFILFDNRHRKFPVSQPTIIQHLCNRQRGIGADGLILWENSTTADCRMRIFNSDGSEAEMCGNGLRCFVKWLTEIGFQLKSYQVEIMNRTLTAINLENKVCIEMGNPTTIEWNVSLCFKNEVYAVHYLDIGVPHAILFVEDQDINLVNLSELGPYIRNYPKWMPKGTNVTIVQQVGFQTLKARTYERGVEGETFACGTGATAAGLAAAYHYQLSSPLTVQTRSGEELKIEFLKEQGKFSKVTLTGPAKKSFQGEIELPENEKEIPFSIACNSSNSVKS